MTRIPHKLLLVLVALAIVAMVAPMAMAQREQGRRGRGGRDGGPGGPGGGFGGLIPRMFPMIHLPRVTGDVRSGLELVARKAPLPSRPRRDSISGPSVTRRNWLPVMFLRP